MLKRLSYFNFGLALFIILWGAWVRLSGSGAGCGDHWPLCNGVVVPLDPSIKTLTEFIHRVTSGIFGITVFWGWILALNTKVRSMKKSFSFTLVFTITEALIGAVLVKKGLVENDDSALRALVISFHLINTLGLLYFLVQNIFLSVSNKKKLVPLRLSEKIIILLFMFSGGTGAIAALGNTLFPETSLIDGIIKDFDSTSHFLINLRIFHPMFAVGLAVATFLYANSQGVNFKKGLVFFIYLSIGWGILNWLLLAPSWGALGHLFIADMFFSYFSYVSLSSRNY
tara:strand:+ start:1563 stop:2414 length:852 start_codon:yes stop_codon:yes gene_type:complete